MQFVPMPSTANHPRKGTGALRDVSPEMLRKEPRVANFRIGA